MEKVFYVRYSNRAEHIAIQETALDAAKWLYSMFPANNNRKPPIYVRWYEDKEQKHALFTIDNRGVVQIR